MDPNDPNSQAQAPAANDAAAPTPDQLTPESLYGPSTPGVDIPAPTADPTMAAPATPMQDMPPMDPMQDVPPAPDPAATDDVYQDTAVAEQTVPLDPASQQNPFETQPDAAGIPPAPPAAEGAPANGLPPLPGKSKLPLIIIAIVVVVLFVSIGSLFLFARPKPKPTPAPVATEEPLSCADDPTQPECSGATPEATIQSTVQPSSTTAPTGSGGSSCQLLGTC